MAARANQIFVGSLTSPSYYFENKSILKVEAESAVALAGEELSIDTFTPTVLYEHVYPMVFKPTDKDGIKSQDGKVMRSKSNTDIRTLPYATPVWWYNGGDLMGKYYIKNVERTARTQYKLNCISAIGLLDKMKHFGGVYSGETFEQVLKDILAPSGILHRLPYDYQEVEYVESNGTQYIDLNLKMSSAMTTVVDFIATDQSSLQMIFGETSANEDSYGFGIASTDHKANYYYGDYTQSVVSGDPVVPVSEESVVIFNTDYDTSNKGYYIDEDIYVISPNYNFTTSTNNLYLFGVNYNGTFSSPFYGRIYSFEILANSKTIHNYVPCYRKSDNVIGFYDLVGKVFYDNDGSGAFTKGDDVGPEDTGSVMQYQIDQSLESQQVYGYLPYATKRENLYKLMVAYNVTMLKTDTGVPYFTRIYGESTESIPSTDVFNTGSIDYGTPASRVEITEHMYTYIEDDDYEEIFNNSEETTVPSEKLVTFNSSPVDISSIYASGITMHYYNCNCAIISGLGVIYGIPYHHTELVVTQDNPNSVEENIVTITDDTLISYINGDSVKSRTYQYYTEAKTIENAINVKGEHCGHKYTILDPFLDEQTAFLTKMSLSSSGILKASSKMIMDYAPTGLGGIYDHCVVLTGSGTWTVPTEATTAGKIMVVLVGGGDGGYAGTHGSTGSTGQNIDTFNSYVVGLTSSTTSLPDYNDGGEGGEGGDAGLGGRVLQVTITSLASSYEYSCGEGGDGGTPEEWSYTEGEESPEISEEEVDPTDGEDTTFGSYSTENGARMPNGVINYSTGELYAVNGKAGTDGGAGGSIGLEVGHSDYGESISYNGMLYKGGNPGTHGYCTYGLTDCAKGSGAVVGHNGNAGSNSTVTYESYDSTYTVDFTVGCGGHAPVPVDADEPTRYGQGGNGGHGGGGGGATASISFSKDIYAMTPVEVTGQETSYISQYQGGKGSRGSSGSKGGDGCVIIYY